MTFGTRTPKSSITSFSNVTTAATPSTAKYHDRMPLILEERQFDDWMRAPPEIAAEMMKPDASAVDAWEVPPEVGNVKNNRTGLRGRIGLL
jgi:putative SOS response-associated peptidase YedK